LVSPVAAPKFIETAFFYCSQPVESTAERLRTAQVRKISNIHVSGAIQVFV
jgi:hypothetical protein